MLGLGEAGAESAGRGPRPGGTQGGPLATTQHSVHHPVHAAIVPRGMLRPACHENSPCSLTAHTQDAMVRRAAVTALLALYSQRDNLPTLHDFTERFLQRFSELVYDRDEVVAMKGVSAPGQSCMLRRRGMAGQS